MGLRALSVILAATAFTAGAASAATFAYDFGSPPPLPTNGESADFDSAPPGLSVNVTGDYYTIDGGGAYSGSGAIDVENNVYGLISDNRNGGWSCTIDCTWGEHAIDSKGAEGDEAMVFTFSAAVKLVSITLGWASGRQFDVIVDGTLLESIGLAGAATYLVGDHAASTTFAIGTRSVTETICTTYGGWFKSRGGHGTVTRCKDKTTDSYIKILGMTVDYTPPPPPPVVPLPAAGLLLAGALGGLGLLRRRKA